MALYEGIALIQEKQAVVLDLGTDYTKFGFTSEGAPRCIVRSEFWCPSERRYKRVHDYKTAEELYDNLVHMLHQLYFRHVLVNPKERKVVVVESLLTPTLFRETLADVLFTHYEVSGALWADSPRLCALTLGVPQALIVSIGARDAEVTAVVHGRPVMRALQAQPLGSHLIHAELARLLDEDNGEKLNLPDYVLEDVRVKTCIVIDRDRALQWAGGTVTAARSVQYGPTSRPAIIVSGRTRELAAEPLFARDMEMSSLPDIVLQCIMQCPVDNRRALAENILVTGGTAEMPGLCARLAQELRHLITEPPYSERVFVKTFKFHSAPSKGNSVAWMGGALLGGGADALTRRALPREKYVRDRRLPDWVCLLDNTPVNHPNRSHADI